MFSAFSIYFVTVVTVHIRATLSLFVAWTAVFAFHIIARRGSAPALAYLLLVGCIVGGALLFLMVATQQDLLNSLQANPASAFNTYLPFASSMQYSIYRMRNYDVSRSGTESRLINSMCDAIFVSTVTITVAAVCSGFAEQYSGIKQQYPAGEILTWSTSILEWGMIVMGIISTQAYQGLTPKEKIKNPYSNSVRSELLFFAMLIVCEIHGVLLLSYPPTNWRDMGGIIAVGLVIGTVYNQVAVPKLDFLNEPEFQNLISRS